MVGDFFMAFILSSRWGGRRRIDSPSPPSVGATLAREGVGRLVEAVDVHAQRAKGEALVGDAEVLAGAVGEVQR